MTDGHRRHIALMGIAALPLILSAVLPPVSFADESRTSVIPSPLTYLVRSTLAEESGDVQGAARYAEAFTEEAPRSSYAAGKLALLLEDAGEDLRALEWGERALSLDSLNADAAMLVGRMRLRSGESSMAVKALTPSLRLLGARPELYALRALAHELDRNYEAALADLKRTDVLLPDFGWVATGILGLALEDNRLDEASQALKLALDLNPNDARTLGLGVELARRTGDTALEELLLRRRADATDAHAEQISAYASFLIREGMLRELEDYLRQIEERGFSPLDVRVEAARSLLVDGNYRGALEAVKPLGQHEGAIAVTARAFVALGQEGRALQCYRRLMRTRAISEEESLVVAYLEIRVGDRRTGVVTLEQIRDGLLDSPRQVLAGSLCYSLLGHPEEAVTLLREGAARGVENPMILEELGSTAAEIGDSLVAEWAFQRLRGLGRETSECLYFLAWTDLNQGRIERAVENLDRSVALDPTNGRALSLLGSLRYRMGQLELARDILIRATQCPDAGPDADRTLARVCRALRLDTEARDAEARARDKHPARPFGLTLFAKP